MTTKQQSTAQQQLTTPKIDSIVTHEDRYKKQQIFSFISNKTLSNICVPISGMFWVCSFIYANQNKISPMQVNFARYIWQMVTILLIVKFTNQKIDFKSKKDYPSLLVRSLISGVSSFTAAFFQTYLPLTVYYTINSSTTIFAFLLNYFLFGIQVTKQQMKAVFIAIIGIVLVINGRAIYQLLDSSYEFKSNFEYNSTSLGVQILMGLLVVVWSLIWAYGIVITGKHHATFHAFIYINSALGYFMSSVFQLTLSPATAEQTHGSFISQPSKWWQTFFYCGLPICIANYIFMLGMFISTNTGVSTMLIQLNIVYGYFISKFRYDEAINYVCLTGAILLIGSIYTTLFNK